MASEMIRITSAPTGPSPLEIREKWKGIELPYLARVTLRSDDCYSPDRQFDRMPPRPPAYTVDVGAAFEALKAHSLETYEWYLKNRGDLFKPEIKVLAIEVACAEEIGEVPE